VSIGWRYDFGIAILDILQMENFFRIYSSQVFFIFNDVFACLAIRASFLLVMFLQRFSLVWLLGFKYCLEKRLISASQTGYTESMVASE